MRPVGTEYERSQVNRDPPCVQRTVFDLFGRQVVEGPDDLTGDG